MMAGAFGMPTTGGQQYMPQAETFAGGVQGYSSSAPIYQQAVEALAAAANPAQAAHLGSFTMDPVTGQVGANAATFRNQPYCIGNARQSLAAEANRKITWQAAANPAMTQAAVKPISHRRQQAHSKQQWERVGQTCYGTKQQRAAWGHIKTHTNKSVVDKTLRDVGGAAQLGLNHSWRTGRSRQKPLVDRVTALQRQRH